MENVCITELPGGLRVVSVALPHVESVSLGIMAGVGSRYESRQMAGASHFVEHLLFKGTAKRSAQAITREIEGRGGYLNAFTQEEGTCYYARIPYNHLKSALNVLCDMYLNPRLAERDVERERRVILEEIMMYRDQPHHVVEEMLGEALWPEHPLGRPVIGYPETLARMDREKIRSYIGRHYASGNTVVALAGRLEHEQCAGMVAEYFEKLPRRMRSRCKAVDDSVVRLPRAFQQKAIEQTHLELGFRCFGRHDRRRHALRVMNTIMGENMSSRLFQQVREKHGLAYSVHSHAHMFTDCGAWVVSAGLDRGRYVKALELIVREVVRIRDKPPSRQELKRAKDYMTGQLRLAAESTSHQMMWLGDNIMNYDRFIPRSEVIAQVNAVTADDVSAVARDILHADNATLAVLSPDLSSAQEDEMNRMIAEM